MIPQKINRCSYARITISRYQRVYLCKHCILSVTSLPRTRPPTPTTTPRPSSRTRRWWRRTASSTPPPTSSKPVCSFSNCPGWKNDERGIAWGGKMTIGELSGMEKRWVGNYPDGKMTGGDFSGVEKWREGYCLGGKITRGEIHWDATMTWGKIPGRELSGCVLSHFT